MYVVQTGVKRGGGQIPKSGICPKCVRYHCGNAKGAIRRALFAQYTVGYAVFGGRYILYPSPIAILFAFSILTELGFAGRSSGITKGIGLLCSYFRIYGAHRGSQAHQIAQILLSKRVLRGGGSPPLNTRLDHINLHSCCESRYRYGTCT